MNYPFTNRPYIRQILLGITCLILAAWSHSNLAPRLASSADLNSSTPTAEVMYLPTGQALDLISFGYRNALADTLWFNAVNYFGRHYQTDQRYVWLGHMCDLVTTLDSRVYDIYYFCATMIAWETQDPERAVNLLTRAIENHPKDWFFLYLRGFYNYFFLQRRDRAKQDFIASAKLPNAHPIAARLAAKKLAENDTGTAIMFLKDMISKATDPLQKDALQHRLLEVIYERDIQNIEKLSALFTARHGRRPKSIAELRQENIQPLSEHDPFGGVYLIDPISGQVRSSTGRKRLREIGSKGDG